MVGSLRFHRTAVILFFLTCLFFDGAGTTLAAQTVEFRISSTEVSKGEPLIVEAIVSGTEKVDPTHQEFREGNVSAFYIGTMHETKIINFKTSQNTILKFQISHRIPGQYKVPPITVRVRGNDHTIPDIRFRVQDKVYANPSIPRSTFPGSQVPSFFGRYLEDEESEQPWGVGDSRVHFQVTKTKLYEGEPALGYFLFFHRYPTKPQFERNPNASISFPYFKTELLNGVYISHPEKISLAEGEGAQTREFFVYPYNREVYALTGLKQGKHIIGLTKFDFLPSGRFTLKSHSLDSIPATVEVLPLPQTGKPRSFTGEVGDFEVSTKSSTTTIPEGGSGTFHIRIAGKGLCDRFQDPLTPFLPDRFPGKIVHIGVRKEKMFQEISKGEFGFLCSAEFDYSVQIYANTPSFEGEVSFFQPGLGKYDTRRVVFPEFHWVERTKQTEESIERDYSQWGLKSNGLGWIGWIAILGLGVGCGVGYYFYQIHPKRMQIRIYLEGIQNRAGSKSGLLLEKALLSKGMTEEEAKFFRILREKYGDRDIPKLWNLLNNSEQDLIYKYSKKGEHNDTSRNR